MSADNLLGNITPQPLACHYVDDRAAQVTIGGVVVLSAQERAESHADTGVPAADCADWYYGNWGLSYIGSDGLMHSTV